MNIKKYCYVLALGMLVIASCKKDDDSDDTTPTITVEDRGEQQVKDSEILQDYLKTHFYELVDVDLNGDNIPEYRTTRFGKIEGDNADKTPIMESSLLETKMIKRFDVDYEIFVLNFRRGTDVPNEKSQPSFTDSVFVTYRGELLYDEEDMDSDGIPDTADVDADGDGEPDSVNEVVKIDTDEDGIEDNSDADADGDGNIDIIDANDNGMIDPDETTLQVDSDGDGIIDEKDPVDNTDPNRKVFDSSVSPIWFDLIGLLNGFREATIDFMGASDLNGNSNDGTFSPSDDFGDFVVFMPSGLGYFAEPQTGIPAYSPLIFNIQLYAVNEIDHDRDGIPSYLEDLDNDRAFSLDADDTDGNRFPNYVDIDDDGDRVPTMDEITVLGDLNDDGMISLDEITFYDDDGDGIENHLDPDDREFKNNE